MIDGRIYTVSFEGIAIVTNPQDMLELTTPSDSICEIISARVGQTSEEGDAAAEMLRVNWTRVTAGSGGTLVTPRPHLTATQATASVTCNRQVTTQGTSPIVVLADAFNLQAGWLYLPVPEERIWMGISEVLVLELPVAPADSTDFTASITFREYDI